MNLTLPHLNSLNTFQKCKYDQTKCQWSTVAGTVELQKPIAVLSEGIDTMFINLLKTW